MIDLNDQTAEGLDSDANYEKSSSQSVAETATEAPGDCCCDNAIDDGDDGHRTGRSNKARNGSARCIDRDEGRNNIDNVETISPTVRRVRLAAGLVDKSDNTEDDEKLFEDSFRERALEEKCGVFGVISNGDWPTSIDVAHIICLGLVGLQHRGQESAGIVTCKYKTEPFNVSRSEGLVSSAFNEMSMMSLKGNLGIGHTRYSTSGGSGCLQLAQPFVVHTKYGTIAVAHNGELVNSSNLRETLLSHGVGLTTGGDSELITQCLSQTPPDEFKHPKFRKKAPLQPSANGAVDYNNCNNINNDVHINGNNNININDHYDNTNKASNGDTNYYHQQHNNQHQPKQQQHQQQQQRSSSSLAKGQQQTALGTPIWKTDLNVDENNITSRLLYLMSLTPVSYSLLVMYNECLYATRDPFGNRPLTIGMLVPPPNAGDIGSIPFSVIDNCFVEGWCVSSESCPFPSVHAKLKRDVEPGEIIKFERNKMPKTLAIMARPPQAESPSFCIFEYVYFARPDSILERQTVYTVRKRCGERLAEESPAVKSDLDKKDFIVAPVPESSIPAALGYSQRSGIPYVEVFCKNRYVGRTFIQPSTRLRRLGVAKKFGPLTENFVGKSIILIDDSIVRGTTIGQLVRLLREAGAKEVHIRIASPPLHFPCYMGINIPTKEELIANHLSPEQLALTLGAASLKYLSVEGLRESVESGIKSQLRADKRRSVMLPEVGNIATNVNMLSSIGSISLSNNSNQHYRGSVKTHTNSSSNHNNSSASSSSSTSGGRRSRSGSQVGASVTLQTGTSTGTGTGAGANANEDDRNDNNNISDEQTGAPAATDANDFSEEDDEEERELRAKVGHCDACLTGRYPVELDDETF